MSDAKPIRLTRVIAIPTVITLAVTILRLVGELKHWPTPWFNTAAGGGGALVGISWLPVVFGPYFAFKLAAGGDTPASSGKAIGFAFLGLGTFVVAVALFVITVRHPSLLTLAAFLLMLIAGFVPLRGWRSLGRVLLAYALAARLPVLIVMYCAMIGNGGAGWGTHYDAVNPVLAHLSFGRKYFYAAILPQLTMWIGWTAVLGSIFGAIFAAVARRGKQSAPAAA
jgi:hypothetical protein